MLWTGTSSLQVHRHGFETELTDAVATGLVTPHSVRLWVRSARPGLHSVELFAGEGGPSLGRGSFRVDDDPRRDGTASVRWPDELEGNLPPLEPQRAYAYAIRREADGTSIGGGRFETPPASALDAPERYSIAVASCHQPFDHDGGLSEHAQRMLEVVEPAFEEHDVKAVVLCGDQMYADLPIDRSLFDPTYFATVAPPGRSSIFDCSRDEVRRLYQERYRCFWSPRAFARLQARFACYPMLDDHELHDNFGSAREHAEPKWAAIRAGALDACHDYQSARVHGLGRERPQSLHYEFAYGTSAVFVMDLRSEKQTDEDGMPRMCSDGQLADLARFLRAHEDKHVLMVVLSVPLVHVPEWAVSIGRRFLGEGTDIADRWAAARDTRNAVLALLYEHRVRRPRQLLVLLGGDVHVGAVSELRWDDPQRRDVPSIFQLTSSALTNCEVPPLQILSALAPHAVATIAKHDDVPTAQVRLLKGVGALATNPYSDLNAGIVEITRRGDRSFVRLKLLGVEDGPPARPTVVFESAELPGPAGAYGKSLD